MLSILTYLHQQNPLVIHRDIKPSNILITNRTGNSIGDIYLVDFGSVQTAASKDEGTITIVGSYGYIPLEQFGGKTVAASDLYSLGMTLIYLITGVHPAELTQANGRVKFNNNNNISGKFTRWLEKMTNSHLNKRFNSAKSAHIALESKDESSGDFSNLRPPNSDVQLYRDRHLLKITYPKYKVHTPIFFVACLLSIIFIVAFEIKLGFLIFLFGSIAISILRFNFPLETYLKTIYIYQNMIIKTDFHDFESNNIKWDKNHKTDPKISSVTYNPSCTFDNKYLDDRGKEIIRGKVKVQPKLSVYVGQNEYPIGNDKFSQAELWWLGQEISDFLGLELQVIYPIPKAPYDLYY